MNSSSSSGSGGGGAMRSSAFPFYSLAQKYSVPKEQSAEKLPLLTHTLLSGEFGGKLVVPMCVMADFYKTLAESFEKNAKIPICEVLAKDEKYFRFFADIDFSYTRQLNRAEIVQLAQTIQSTVKRFFQGNSGTKTFDTLVLTTSNPPEDAVPSSGPPDDENCREKTGIHLVMPNLWVTAEQCLTMRMSVLEDMKSVLYDDLWSGNIDLDNTNGVEDQLDRNVYCEKIGLRMPFAVKFEKCDFCKNNSVNRKTCANCLGRGKVCMGRAYKLRIFIKTSGEDYGPELPLHMKSPYSQMRHCTIRIAESKAEIARKIEEGTNAVIYCKPPTAPSDIPNCSTSNVQRLRHQKSHGGILPYAPPASLPVESGCKDFIEVRDKTKREAALQAVKEAIMTLFNVTQNIDAVKINSMKMRPMNQKCRHDKIGSYRNVRYYIIAKGPYQHYCKNLKPSPTPEHSSSSARWLIDRCAIYQMCFSTKQTSTKLLAPDMPCSKFRSAPIPLSTRNALALFEGESVAMSTLAVAEELYSTSIPDELARHFTHDDSSVAVANVADETEKQEELNKEYLDRSTELSESAKHTILFFNKTANELKMFMHKSKQETSGGSSRSSSSSSSSSSGYPNKRRRYNG